MDERRPQPRTGEDEDELEKPEEKPSFLTARELQAPHPAKGESVARPEEPTDKPQRKRKSS